MWGEWEVGYALEDLEEAWGEMWIDLATKGEQLGLRKLPSSQCDGRLCQL